MASPELSVAVKPNRVRQGLNRRRNLRCGPAFRGKGRSSTTGSNSASASPDIGNDRVGVVVAGLRRKLFARGFAPFRRVRARKGGVSLDIGMDKGEVDALGGRQQRRIDASAASDDDLLGAEP